MSKDKCPKCGSECAKIATSFLWESFVCGTELHSDGKIIQSKECELTELKKSHKRLIDAGKKVIEVWEEAKGTDAGCEILEKDYKYFTELKRKAVKDER